MIARGDYAGPITKSAEAMFARAERAKADPAKGARRSSARPKSPIREAMDRLGLTVTALRNWESAGIIAFRRVNGRRLVDETALECLAAVIALRRAGFSIRQISWISDTLPPTAAAMRKALQVRESQVVAARQASIARAMAAGRAAA